MENCCNLEASMRLETWVLKVSAFQTVPFSITQQLLHSIMFLEKACLQGRWRNRLSVMYIWIKINGIKSILKYSFFNVYVLIKKIGLYVNKNFQYIIKLLKGFLKLFYWLLFCRYSRRYWCANSKWLHNSWHRDQIGGWNSLSNIWRWPCSERKVFPSWQVHHGSPKGSYGRAQVSLIVIVNVIGWILRCCSTVPRVSEVPWPFHSGPTQRAPVDETETKWQL